LQKERSKRSNEIPPTLSSTHLLYGILYIIRSGDIEMHSNSKVIANITGSGGYRLLRKSSNITD